MLYGLHGYSTLVFMIEVGVVATVSRWRLALRLGHDGPATRIALETGLAAATGLLAGSILAFAVGYEVVPWRRLSMVWATVVALPVSGLAAGAALGVRLAHTTVICDAR